MSQIVITKCDKCSSEITGDQKAFILWIAKNGHFSSIRPGGNNDESYTRYDYCSTGCAIQELNGLVIKLISWCPTCFSSRKSDNLVNCKDVWHTIKV